MKGISPSLMISLVLTSAVVASADDGDWEFLRSHLTDSHKSQKIWQKEIDTFRFFPTALAFIAQADSIEIYEGLPHPTFEAVALKQQLASHETVKIGGYPFYAQPQAITPKAKVRLTELMTNASGFTPFTGYKMCGGFHPDYAIRFKKEKESCDVLICFGCHDAEVRFHKNLITCSTRKGWNEFFAPYAQKRPTQTLSQQAGKGKPESKSEDRDKPQPEADERSR